MFTDKKLAATATRVAFTAAILWALLGSIHCCARFRITGETLLFSCRSLLPALFFG